MFGPSKNQTREQALTQLRLGIAAIRGYHILTEDSDAIHYDLQQITYQIESQKHWNAKTVNLLRSALNVAYALGRIDATTGRKE